MNANQSSDKSSNQQNLVLSFLGIGILLFGVSLYLSYKTPNGPDQDSRLARVSRETGMVSLIRNSYTKKEKVDRQSSVFSLDSIETNDSGEALLSFESLYLVRVLENTFVTLEQVNEGKNKHVVLVIKRGAIRIESMGRESELVIAKNGQRVFAQDYSDSDLSTIPALTATATPDTSAAASSLSEEEIAAVMASQSALFKRCYTQLLQKDEKAQGTATLSFTIENNGKITEANLDSPILKNEEFKKCLLDVMTRVSFRNYSGPQISTRYPLKFE